MKAFIICTLSKTISLRTLNNLSSVYAPNVPAQVANEYIYSENKIQTPTHWILIGPSMTVQARLCYRPAVFFSHLRFIPLSFPQKKKKKSARVSKIRFDFFLLYFSKHYISLKPRNFKLTKSGNVLCHNRGGGGRAKRKGISCIDNKLRR
jgi:aspartate-semialdehyde dehydrogenase